MEAIADRFSFLSRCMITDVVNQLAEDLFIHNEIEKQSH